MTVRVVPRSATSGRQQAAPRLLGKTRLVSPSKSIRQTCTALIAWPGRTPTSRRAWFSCSSSATQTSHRETCLTTSRTPTRRPRSRRPVRRCVLRTRVGPRRRRGCPLACVGREDATQLVAGAVQRGVDRDPCRLLRRRVGVGGRDNLVVGEDSRPRDDRISPARHPYVAAGRSRLRSLRWGEGIGDRAAARGRPDGPS